MIVFPCAETPRRSEPTSYEMSMRSECVTNYEASRMRECVPMRLGGRTNAGAGRKIRPARTGVGGRIRFGRRMSVGESLRRIESLSDETAGKSNRVNKGILHPTLEELFGFQLRQQGFTSGRDRIEAGDAAHILVNPVSHKKHGIV